MKNYLRHSSVLALLLLVAPAGMTGNGCQVGPDFSPLAGLWSISRGDVAMRITYTVNNGGEVTETSTGGTLAALDPADFPAELTPLVEQWNNGLNDLNARIDEALPDQVVVSFPGFGQITITNPTDVTKTGTGLINEQAAYGFLTDASGAGAGSDQGAGAILQVASIEGQFDTTALTTSGVLARRLAVYLIGSNNSGASLVVEITIAYSGTRAGDAP